MEWERVQSVIYYDCSSGWAEADKCEVTAGRGAVGQWKCVALVKQILKGQWWQGKRRGRRVSSWTPVATAETTAYKSGDQSRDEIGPKKPGPSWPQLESRDKQTKLRLLTLILGWEERYVAYQKQNIQTAGLRLEKKQYSTTIGNKFFIEDGEKFKMFSICEANYRRNGHSCCNFRQQQLSLHALLRA